VRRKERGTKKSEIQGGRRARKRVGKSSEGKDMEAFGEEKREAQREEEWEAMRSCCTA